MQSKFHIDDPGSFAEKLDDCPRFTREEERELAFTMVAGKAARKELDELQKAWKDKGRSGKPNNKQTRGLQRKIDEGLAAREQLILSNTPWAIALGKRGCPAPSLVTHAVSEAIVGLIIAVDKFDPNMGYRLTTYASNWIRRQVFMETHVESRLIRLPPNAAGENTNLANPNSIRQANTIKEGILQFGSYSASHTSIDKADAESLVTDGPCGKAGTRLSYDTRVCRDDEEGDKAKAELLEFQDRELRRLIAYLPPVHQLVMLRRYHGHTLQDVADDRGVCREWIRQLEKYAKDRIKALMEIPMADGRELVDVEDGVVLRGVDWQKALASTSLGDIETQIKGAKEELKAVVAAHESRIASLEVVRQALLVRNGRKGAKAAQETLKRGGDRTDQTTVRDRLISFLDKVGVASIETVVAGTGLKKTTALSTLRRCHATFVLDTEKLWSLKQKVPAHGEDKAD